MSISVAGREAKKTRRWGRRAVAGTLKRWREGQAKGYTQSELAEKTGIARTTVAHWWRRQVSRAAALDEAAFFESPAGLEVLHRLMVAAHLVMGFEPQRGIRGVCELLKLSGLSAFVASSYGAQQAVAAEMEAVIGEFADSERRRLGAQMPPRQIAVSQDETFHPDICLVGIEPVSDFIVLERYAERRDAATWNAALAEAVQGLNVAIVQSTSDEGKGLLAHVRRGLKVHHSPDLFHIQRALCRPLFRRLANAVRQAQNRRDKAAEATASWEEARQRAESEPRRRGRPPNLGRRVTEARAAEAEARRALEAVEHHRQQAKEAVKDLSNAYHPFDLHSGKIRLPEVAKVAFERCFARIDAAAEHIGLGEKARAGIEQARRGVAPLLATLAFFFRMMTVSVEALALPAPMERLLCQYLIPGLYLQRVAGQAQHADERVALRAVAEELLAPVRRPDSPFAALHPQERAHVEQVARDCANLFQRSSSCVEGRNGQLAFWHQHLRQIRPGRLAALTAVHNYFEHSADGTTPAERLFGAKPRDLFVHLLRSVRLPPQPAAKRPRPPPQPILAPSPAVDPG